MTRWIKIDYKKLQYHVNRKFVESNYQYISEFFNQYWIWQQRFYHLRKRPIMGAKLEKIVRLMWINTDDIKAD